MPLESLSNEQFNIHDLVIEQDTKKPMDTEKTKQIIEKLKEHNLWQRDEYEFWYENEPDHISTRLQLPYVWIESLYDMSKAQEDYDWVKKNNYDHNKGEWNYCDFMDFENEELDEDYRKEADARFSGDQLLDVIIMSIFDKRQAHENLIKLQNSQFYDQTREQWICTIDHTGKTKSDIRQSETQILEIITEAQFDKEKARAKYDKLKRSAFYNHDTDTWVDYLNEDQTQSTFPYQFTAPRLLDVLALSFFDKESARDKLQEMKDSGAYDADTESWWRYSDEDRAYKYHDLDLQMYGALCEYYTSGDLDENITNKLPEVRSY